MAEQSQPAKKSSQERGPAPAWLRWTAVCVLLVVVPIAVYLFLYRSSRVEQATIRNFRTLDAAAERVRTVLSNLTSVVDGSSFGISPSMLDQVTERLTGLSDAITGPRTWCYGDSEPPQWTENTAFHDYLPSSAEPTDEQRLEFAYRLAAHTLLANNDNGSTEKLWYQLYCLVHKHRQYSSPIETIDVDVNPLPRPPLFPLIKHCPDPISVATCATRLREWLPSEACSPPRRPLRLDATRKGMAAIAVDCRPFKERSRELHNALETFDGAAAVIAAIDLFGIGSTAQLDDLMQEATGYLSRFFDNHMIADSAGRILFEPNVTTTSVTETDEGRVATPAFSNHVDISRLLRAEPASPDRAASPTADAAGNPSTTTSPLSFRGHSFVETVRVENVALRVFVHPFVIDDVDMSDDSERSSETRTSAHREARPTFYMIGIVDDSEFESAAIRLRLSLVVDGTLALLLLLTLCPLLWFWTAGDRFVINRLGLAGICATPVVGVVLFVVLACGIVTNRVDEYVLDNILQVASDRILRLFDKELHEEILALSSYASEPETYARQRAGRTPLDSLEKRFYCDDSNRDFLYGREHIPGLKSMFILDNEGRQVSCWSNGALIRTPKLTLAFRDYFVRPKEGVLWDPPSSGLVDTVSCNERSLISCVVHSSPPESQNNQEDPNARAVFANREVALGNRKQPFYLERIDSIVRGDVQTVLAINTKEEERPVAVSGVRLKSLDRTVAPHHVDFAVVDRETGQTLFHSDDELAMVTKFTDDAGGDPALRSLLHSSKRGTLSLDYAGIPIRAHVRTLRGRSPVGVSRIPRS